VGAGRGPHRAGVVPTMGPPAHPPAWPRLQQRQLAAGSWELGGGGRLQHAAAAPRTWNAASLSTRPMPDRPPFVRLATKSSTLTARCIMCAPLLVAARSRACSQACLGCRRLWILQGRCGGRVGRWCGLPAALARAARGDGRHAERRARGAPLPQPATPHGEPPVCPADQSGGCCPLFPGPLARPGAGALFSWRARPRAPRVTGLGPKTA
jgi:hypothetical protein